MKSPENRAMLQGHMYQSKLESLREHLFVEASDSESVRL